MEQQETVPKVIVIQQTTTTTTTTTSSTDDEQSPQIGDIQAYETTHGGSSDLQVTLMQTHDQERTYNRLMVLPDDVTSGRQSSASDVRATSPSSLDAISFTIPSSALGEPSDYRELNQDTLTKYYGDVTPYGTVARPGASSVTSQRSGSPQPNCSTPNANLSTSVYSTLLRTTSCGPQQVAMGDRRLQHVDFLPSSVKGKCGKREFRSFKDCVNQSNQWLADQSCVKLVGCETLRHRLDHSHRINPESTTSHDRSYVNGLRLWFYLESETTCGAVELAYQNFLPKYKNEGHRYKEGDSPFFEEFPQTLTRINESLQRSPLKGDIISIESLAANYKMVYRTQENLEVDTSHLSIDKAGKWNFTFVRIFYLKTNQQEPHEHPKLVCQDFVPHPVTYPPSVLEFQPISAVAAKANRWFEKNKHVEIVSSELIEVPFKLKYLDAMKGHVKSTHMSYEWPHHSVKWNTLRVLRLWVRVLPRAPVRPHVKEMLEVRTFAPEQLTTSGCCGAQKPIFATTSDTTKRIDHWVAQTGADVIGIETDSVEAWTGQQRHVGNPLIERSYNKEDYSSKITRSAMDYRLTVFRVTYRPNALTNMESSSTLQPVKPCCCFVGCQVM